MAHGRFGFAQNVTLDSGVFERSGAGQAARPGVVDGLFDGPNLPLSHQREVRQTIFDRPPIGLGTPVELGLGESGGQFFCLTCNLFELLTILFEFQKHYLELCHLPGNSPPPRSVYRGVKSRPLWVISLLIAGALGAAYSDYDSIKRKLDSIESDQVRPGSRVELSPRELNAYAEHEAPAGVRNPRIQILSNEVASGTALVDFGKLERSQGRQPGWLMSKLLDGERPVSVTVRIRSSGGRATVDVQRVQISGLTIDGGTLDFLIQNIRLAMYPTAVVGRPFEMGHRIERIDVAPGAVRVLISR